MENNRIVVIDTETTGLNPKKDRIIELACVEILDRKISNHYKRWYVNPEQSVSPESFAIHGLNDEFLKKQVLFKTIIDEFDEFIKDATLVAHNASFDINFINEEFSRVSKKPLANEVIDTLKIARKKHFGQANNLDALCKRYLIDNRDRKLHGALLDANLLAQVYLSMQVEQNRFFGCDSLNESTTDTQPIAFQKQQFQVAEQALFKVLKANPKEIQEHQAFQKSFLNLSA